MIPLLNIDVSYNGRLFALLPVVLDPDALFQCIVKLPSISINDIIESPTAIWIEFMCEEYRFIINSENGQYRLIADELGYPEELLQRIADHVNDTQEMLLAGQSA